MGWMCDRVVEAGGTVIADFVCPSRGLSDRINGSGPRSDSGGVDCATFNSSERTGHDLAIVAGAPQIRNDF